MFSFKTEIWLIVTDIGWWIIDTLLLLLWVWDFLVISEIPCKYINLTWFSISVSLSSSNVSELWGKTQQTTNTPTLHLNIFFKGWFLRVFCFWADYPISYSCLFFLGWMKFEQRPDPTDSRHLALMPGEETTLAELLETLKEVSCGVVLWLWYPKQNTPKWPFLKPENGSMVVGYHHFRNPPNLEVGWVLCFCFFVEGSVGSQLVFVFFFLGRGRGGMMKRLQNEILLFLFSRIVSVVAFWQKSESRYFEIHEVPLNLGNCQLSLRVACGSLKGNGDG